MKYLLLGLLLFSISLEADELIEFPEEELARESVLPQFDRKKMVLRRRIRTKRRFSMGGLVSASLTEPFYNPMGVGAYGTYHMDENRGIHLYFISWLSGLGTNGEGIRQRFPAVDFNYAPAPEMLFGGDYQLTPFYGKISLSKKTALNLSIYGLLGGGLFTIGGEMSPLISAGIGQKLFFNRQLAFRLDFRGFMYQGPNQVKPTSGTFPSSPQPASAFEKHLVVGLLLNLGLTYLF